MDVCRLSIVLTSRGIGWMHQNQAKELRRNNLINFSNLSG